MIIGPREPSLLKTLAIALLALALIGFGVWWTVTVWSECREHGHSIMYCLTLLDGGR